MTHTTNWSRYLREKVGDKTSGRFLLKHGDAICIADEIEALIRERDEIRAIAETWNKDLLGLALDLYYYATPIHDKTG